MKNKWVITIVVLLVFISVISLFVIKSSASQDSVYVEGCTPYNIEIKRENLQALLLFHGKAREMFSIYFIW